MPTKGSPTGNPDAPPKEATSGAQRVADELAAVTPNDPGSTHPGKLDYGINRLNSTDPPVIRRTTDNTSVLGLMREAGLKGITVDCFKNVGRWRGTVWRVDIARGSGTHNPVTSPYGVLTGITQGSKQTPTFKVRIPDLHSMLPRPGGYSDDIAIDMLPTFHMGSTIMAEQGIPTVGEEVWVDFHDRNNFRRGYVIEPVNSSGNFGDADVTPAGNQAQRFAASEAFDQVCTDLPTKPPEGDSIVGGNVIIPSHQTGPPPKPREENRASGYMRNVADNPAGPISQTWGPAHPRTQKLWHAALRASDVLGNTWIGKYEDNGSGDSLERESAGRETIIFTPQEVDSFKPVEVVYYFHDVGGFDQEEFIKRVAPALKKMDFEKRNFVFVYHELPWSRSDIGKGIKRSESTSRTADVFRKTDVGGDFDKLHAKVIKTIGEALGINNIAYYSFVAVGKGGLALKNMIEARGFEYLVGADSTELTPSQIGSVTLANADFANKNNYDNLVSGHDAHNHSWTWKIWDFLKDIECEFNILCTGKEEFAPIELYSKGLVDNGDYFSWYAMRRVPDTPPFLISSTGEKTPQTRDQSPYDEVPDEFRPTANSLRFVHDCYMQHPKINSSLIILNPNTSQADDYSAVANKDQAITVAYTGLNMSHEQVGNMALFWTNTLHINKYKFAKPKHSSPAMAGNKGVAAQEGYMQNNLFGIEEKLISDQEYKALARRFKRTLNKYPRAASGMVNMGSLCGTNKRGDPKVGQGDWGLDNPASRSARANRKLIEASGHVKRFRDLNYIQAASIVSDPTWVEESGQPEPMTFDQINAPNGYDTLKARFGKKSKNKKLWKPSGRTSWHARPHSVFPHWFFNGVGGSGPGVTAKELIWAEDPTVQAAAFSSEPLGIPSYAAQFLKAQFHAVMDQMGRIYYLGGYTWDSKGQCSGGIECVGYVTTIRMLTFMLVWGSEGGPITKIDAVHNITVPDGNGFWNWFESMLNYTPTSVSWTSKIYKVGKYEASKKGWFPIAPVGSGSSWVFPGGDKHGAKNHKAPAYYLNTPNNVNGFKGGMGTNMWSGRNLMPGDFILMFMQPFSPDCTDERAGRSCRGPQKIGKKGHSGFNRPGYALGRDEPAFRHIVIVFANEETGGDLWVAESGGPYNGTGAMPLELFLSYRKGTYFQAWQPPEMFDVWASVTHVTGTPSGRPNGAWTKTMYRNIMVSLAQTRNPLVLKGRAQLPSSTTTGLPDAGPGYALPSDDGEFEPGDYDYE